MTECKVLPDTSNPGKGQPTYLVLVDRQDDLPNINILPFLALQKRFKDILRPRITDFFLTD